MLGDLRSEEGELVPLLVGTLATGTMVVPAKLAQSELLLLSPVEFSTDTSVSLKMEEKGTTLLLPMFSEKHLSPLQRGPTSS